MKLLIRACFIVSSVAGRLFVILSCMLCACVKTTEIRRSASVGEMLHGHSPANTSPSVQRPATSLPCSAMLILESAGVFVLMVKRSLAPGSLEATNQSVLLIEVC